MCVYIYVYMCVCMCVCIYIYIYIYIYNPKDPPKTVEINRRIQYSRRIKRNKNQLNFNIQKINI